MIQVALVFSESTLYTNPPLPIHLSNKQSDRAALGEVLGALGGGLGSFRVMDYQQQFSAGSSEMTDPPLDGNTGRQ